MSGSSYEDISGHICGTGTQTLFYSSKSSDSGSATGACSLHKMTFIYSWHFSYIMDTGNYIDVSTYTDLSDEHLLQTFLPSSEEDMTSKATVTNKNLRYQKIVWMVFVSQLFIKTK